jgi:hypothetical protein
MQLDKALGLSSERNSVLSYQQPVLVRPQMALEHPQWGGPWRKTTLTGGWVRGKMLLLGGTEGRRGRRWQADSGLGFLFLGNCSPLSKTVAVSEEDPTLFPSASTGDRQEGQPGRRVEPQAQLKRP